MTHTELVENLAKVTFMSVSAVKGSLLATQPPYHRHRGPSRRWKAQATSVTHGIQTGRMTNQLTVHVTPGTPARTTVQTYLARTLPEVLYVLTPATVDTWSLSFTDVKVQLPAALRLLAVYPSYTYSITMTPYVADPSREAKAHMQDNFKCMISQCGELTAKDLEITIIHLITQSNTCAEIIETFLTNVDGLGGVNFTCQEGANWFTALATFICRGVVLTIRAAGRRVIPGHAAPGRRPIYELALTADFDYDQLTPDNKEDIADFIELVIGSPLAPIPPADVSPNMVAVTNGIYQMTFPDKKVLNTTYTLTMVFISLEQLEFFMSSPGVSTFNHGSASAAPEQTGYKHSLPLYLRRGAPGYLVFRTAARSTKLYLKTSGQPSATTDTTSVVLAVRSLP
jgi:hypothetical protein